jgi:hypothetical protein
LSKLDKLRGNSNQAAIFSNNVDAPTASIFARLQGQKTPVNQQTSNRKRYMPQRWRLKKGESKTLVIVDEQFTFAMREHNLKGSDGWFHQHRCIADYDSCPICALPDNRPYDCVILTVLDTTPWEKDGVTHDYTKRYLALKKGDYEKFKTIASTQNNQLRGIVLEMSRGWGEKDSANGVPSFVNKLSEEELIEMFGSPEKKYPSGFTVPANSALAPFNYEDIFPIPTRDELAKVTGAGPRPGSEADLATDDPPWEETTLNLSENLEFPDVD